MRIFTIILILALSCAVAMAGTITGKVTAKEGGEALVGANVYLKGTTMGAATDEEGMYRIKADDGTYQVVCDYVGYAQQVVTITVEGDVSVDFQMVEYLFAKTIEVIADRAKERETPVAFSTVDKKAMEVQLGSRDIPLVLNTTPSVYATMQGGGAGDARVNIRGFDQRNIAIMINGMPVNDMENGWVYWSNWDGVGDATSSIQIQRGLSATNLATPSIGGTMNIITDPTAHQMGFKFKQEYGSGTLLKSTLSGHSGLIDNKYAVSATVVRKIGEGIVDKTWTDAWAYYFGASYNLNERNRLELYALGAPQRHGQNLYKQNIGAYSHDFAKDLDDYDPAALDDYAESGSGILYNENWNEVSSSYSGKQYWNGSSSERYDKKFINERENYYHKPLVNLNWFSQISDNMSEYLVLYYSGGQGGGSGTLGSIKWDYASEPTRIADWDATIANNTQSDTAFGILRNSVNNQWTIGAISKTIYKFNKNLTGSFGLDWRTAEIEHYREVRDLLGGKFYVDMSNEFESGSQFNKKLGDKVAYNFTNTVDWFGTYGQAEYTTGPVTAYGTLGYSMIQYTYTNHFRKGDDGNELTAETDWINGYQVKGGASYRLSNSIDFFGNLGYVSKVPIFDHVIDDYAGTITDDPENEKFMAVEGGANFRGMDGKLVVKANAYYTEWKDRSRTVGVQLADGDDGLVSFTGMNSQHMGFELEASYQPMALFRVDAMAAINDWKYTDDVTGTLKDYGATGGSQTYTYYVKDLKVGDAPQTQFALTGSVYPMPGLMGQLVFTHYRDHYSAWDPFGRTDPTDRTQSWLAPNYSVIDFHAAYDLPLNVNGVKFQLFAHVFNLLDSEYIQDSVDNSQYNGFDGDHDADDAEVYFGLPRYFNVGLAISY